MKSELEKEELEKYIQELDLIKNIVIKFKMWKKL